MLVVGVPVADVAHADAGDGGIPISVTVTPSSPAGTVSAVLTGGASIAWAPGPQRLAMGLLVVDNRPEPGGWQVAVSQRTRLSASGALWLVGIGNHSPSIAGWPPAFSMRHLSTGQPLSRPTVVLATSPGDAPPWSWTQIEVGAPPAAPTDPYRMLVTVASAP